MKDDHIIANRPLASYGLGLPDPTSSQRLIKSKVVPKKNSPGAACYGPGSGPAEQGRPGGPWPTQLQKIVLQPDGDLAELPVKGMR